VLLTANVLLLSPTFEVVPDQHTPGIAGSFHWHRNLAKKTGRSKYEMQSFGSQSPKLVYWECLLDLCAATQHRYVPRGLIQYKVFVSLFFDNTGDL
jgi:hypothetical protein